MIQFFNNLFNFNDSPSVKSEGEASKVEEQIPLSEELYLITGPSPGSPILLDNDPTKSLGSTRNIYVCQPVNSNVLNRDVKLFCSDIFKAIENNIETSAGIVLVMTPPGSYKLNYVTKEDKEAAAEATLSEILERSTDNRITTHICFNEGDTQAPSIELYETVIDKLKTQIKTELEQMPSDETFSNMHKQKCNLQRKLFVLEHEIKLINTPNAALYSPSLEPGQASYLVVPSPNGAEGCPRFDNRIPKEGLGTLFRQVDEAYKMTKSSNLSTTSENDELEQNKRELNNIISQFSNTTFENLSLFNKKVSGTFQRELNELYGIRNLDLVSQIMRISVHSNFPRVTEDVGSVVLHAAKWAPERLVNLLNSIDEGLNNANASDEQKKLFYKQLLYTPFKARTRNQEGIVDRGETIKARLIDLCSKKDYTYKDLGYSEEQFNKINELERRHVNESLLSKNRSEASRYKLVKNSLDTIINFIK